MDKKAQFLEEIQRDFTFQANLNAEQQKLLLGVKEAFDAAKETLATEVEAVIGNGTHAVEKTIEQGRSVLRKAERRANAAIALDYQQSITEAEARYELSATHPKEEVSTTRSAQCAIVTKTFLTLAMTVGALIPYGRRASLFKTYLEDARGEYIDAVHEYHDYLTKGLLHR